LSTVSAPRALLNACIVAGSGFFYTLMGVRFAILNANWMQTIAAAAIVAGAGFFTRLGLDYGVQPTPPAPAPIDKNQYQR
jgi:hypothetical protein